MALQGESGGCTASSIIEDQLERIVTLSCFQRKPDMRLKTLQGSRGVNQTSLLCSEGKPLANICICRDSAETLSLEVLPEIA
jgi:hypothetical protein